MWHAGRVLAKFVPLKHRIDVKFEFEDEGSRRLVVHRLEVLLNRVVGTTQFLSGPILETCGFQDHLDVCLVYEPRAIVVCLQAFNRFGT